MERDVALAFAFLVVHIVAFLDHDAMHLDGTARLGRHHDLVGHHLAEEGQQRCPVLFGAEPILTAHKQST